MPRITKPPEERRQEIIDCAYRLFEIHGFKKMQMKDIANELNVAHGLVYHYFESKEALFDAVITQFFEKGISNIVKITKLSCSPKEKMIAVFQQIANDNNQIIPLAAAIYEEDDGEVIRQKLRYKKLELLYPLLALLIAEGIEKGDFDCSYPEETARFLLYGDMGVKQGFKGSFNELSCLMKHFYEVILGTKF